MTNPQPQPLRVLIVEDNDLDAALVLRSLEQSGFDPRFERVETEKDFTAALGPHLDVILADFHLPTFGAPRALALLKTSNVEVPLIVVSGSIGEESAVQLLQAGASDYLLKDRLARLGQAVQRVLDERRSNMEKRQSEEALRDLEGRMRFALTAARVGVWDADLRTGRLTWSDMLETLHGLAPGTFAGTYDAFIERVHPNDRAEVARAVNDARHGHTESKLVYRTLWPDGTVHWISGLGQTFYDEAGHPLRAAGIGVDITESRLLEEQFHQAQKVESIGLLAGGIAHDFNNLLTAMQGYCELLRVELGEDSPLQEDLSQIRQAGERAATLTRQLLAFSRRQVLEPRVFDMRDVVRGIAPMLDRLIGEDVAVKFRVTDEDARVKADAGQIEQVALNLALNARDAMPQGGSMLLEVDVTHLDEAYARQHVAVKPGSYVMLSVSDTGTGMDAATQARIFEPFFTTKGPGRGTGLGLSMVYGIVKQSGGNIWVYSEPGHGSSFKIYLPRVDELESRTTAQPELEIVAGSETVLVVEDEPGVRELVRRVLDRHGYRVLVAATPLEALAIVREYTEPIHVLLSDVVLPEMSGRELAEQVVALRTDVRVIHISGYTDDAVVRLGELKAGTAFLQKPFTPAALARKVREVLNEPGR